MEDTNDYDIYADLPKFRYDDSLEKLQASNKSLSEEITHLNEALVKITKEKDEYQTKCVTLAKNISSLLKTAQAEIQRKDRLIMELRTQIADSASKNHSYRKRRLENDMEPGNAGNAKRNIYERDDERDHFSVNDHFSRRISDKISKESKNILTDNKDLLTSNNKTGAKSTNEASPDNVCTRNEKTSTSLPKNNVLPLTHKCKTLYSQRMFQKLYGVSATNGSQESLRIETKDKQNLMDRNASKRNDFFKSASTHSGVTKLDEKHSENMELRSRGSSTNFEVSDSLNVPLSSGVNKHSNCINNTYNPINDKKLLNSENRSRVVRSSEQQPLNSNINEASATLFQKINSNKDLGTMKNPLKTLSSSAENHNSDLNDKDENLGIGLRINDKNLIYSRELQSSQRNSQILPQDAKLISSDSKNDSSKFLRPISSTVIKKSHKKIVLPISNCWNGLVKTVDNMNCKKQSNENITATAATLAVNAEVKSIDDENKLKENLSLEERPAGTSHQNTLEELLFGSPLKWADNSNESVPGLELTSPAVYEDSCSAHIENTKFNLTSVKPCLQKPNTAPTNPSDKDNTGEVEIRCPKRNQIESEKGTISNADKWIRAFEEVGGNKQKMKSIFSPLKSDSCKSSSTSALNRESSIDLTLNFPFKSKYEDSVLGQFDDTTQFVSALTKVESKISPLNTPVKSIPIRSVNTSTVLNSDPLDQKEFSQTNNNLESSEVTNLRSLQKNKFDGKPINILYPRKTPRIVTYNKSKEEKSVAMPSSAVTDIANKSNRFAINDAFISQQEEKVLRICQNNFDDPIAITISAKSKIKGKESNVHHNLQGKGTQAHSPRKTKMNSPLRKNKTNAPPKILRNQNNVLCKVSDGKIPDNSVNSLLHNHISNVIASTSCDDRKKTDENTFENKPKESTEGTVVKETFDPSETTKESGLIEKGPSRIVVSPNLNFNKNSERLRVQNFKPSSHLKKMKNIHSVLQKKLECERSSNSSTTQKEVSFSNNSCKQIEVLNSNDTSPLLNKSNNGRIVTSEDNGKQNHRDPCQSPNVIVRSSKKPSFVSTTLLDDVCTNTSSVKLSDKTSRNQSNEIEITEWILKPITFDSNHRSPKKHKIIDCNKEVPQYSKVHSNIKRMVQPNKGSKTYMRSNSSSEVSPKQTHTKVKGLGPSPNKIIRARRPLNFGVRITLD